MALVNSTRADDAFRALAAKYAVLIPDDWALVAAEKNARPVLKNSDGDIPLLPWRQERRFVELAKLVASNTVEDVVMCRFSCTAARGSSLTEILCREFDLLEWLNRSPIQSLCASVTDAMFANVLVRLENGCAASVEAGVTLPSENAETIDRHELIGRRGVASDRVVDTQMPQSSIYLYKDGQTDRYTDTDAELFGLSADEVNLVRAAVALAASTDPDKIETLKNRRRRLTEWTATVFESNAARRRRTREGDAL